MTSEITKSLVDKITQLIEATVGEVQANVPVHKQFQEEKMEAIEWLYPVEQDDAHGERMDQEEMRKMVDSLNKANTEGRLSANINHAVNTNGWSLIKAWINEVDCYIGDTFVPEGWPLVKTKFHSKALWEDRKSGRLGGLSMGAKGQREIVND